MALPPKKRSELRSEAHKLSPVVIIGDKGLTDEVLAEIDRSLKAHELIKVRAAGADRDAREIWFETICEKLGAEEVQEIGKVLVLYRKNPGKESGPGPSARSAARGDKPRSGARGDKARSGAGVGKARSGAGDDGKKRRRARDDKLAVKRTGRPRSRTPSPRPASEPRRRRPRTSR